MASTDSDVGEKVDGMRWIRWTACTGTGGRHRPDRVAGFRRIRWPTWAGLRIFLVREILLTNRSLRVPGKRNHPLVRAVYIHYPKTQKPPPFGHK